jgi:hypothetical protein
VFFGEEPFVLALQVGSPTNGEVKVTTAVGQNLDGVRVRNADELGLRHGGERCNEPLFDPLVEELHILGAGAEDLADDPFDQPLGQFHIAEQIAKRDLGLDHPKLGQMPRGIAVLSAEGRPEGVDFAEGCKVVGVARSDRREGRGWCCNVRFHALRCAHGVPPRS